MNKAVVDLADEATPPLCFSLPFPPSMNGLYGINFQMRSVYLTNDARYWKSKAKLMIPKIPFVADKYYVELEFHNSWYFKNGKMKKSDVQNLIKIVVDAICEKLGFDDSLVWLFSAVKIQSDKPKVQVKLGVLHETDGKEAESVEKVESGSSKKS